jgi:hypothetical protein
MVSLAFLLWLAFRDLAVFRASDKSGLMQILFFFILQPRLDLLDQRRNHG